jgi:hypothetical protein
MQWCIFCFPPKVLFGKSYTVAVTGTLTLGILVYSLFRSHICKCVLVVPYTSFAKCLFLAEHCFPCRYIQDAEDIDKYTALFGDGAASKHM